MNAAAGVAHDVDGRGPVRRVAKILDIQFYMVFISVVLEKVD